MGANMASKVAVNRWLSALCEPTVWAERLAAGHIGRSVVAAVLQPALAWLIASAAAIAAAALTGTVLVLRYRKPASSGRLHAAPVRLPRHLPFALAGSAVDRLAGSPAAGAGGGVAEVSGGAHARRAAGAKDPGFAAEAPVPGGTRVGT